MAEPWDRIEAEVRGAYLGKGSFTLRAYSEAMPPPYVGIKPYAPERGHGAVTFGGSHAAGLDIDEYEHAHDLTPGLDRIADHLVLEIGKLVAGESHELPKALLEGNPAWPQQLQAAAHGRKLGHDPVVVICPVALSRTQDDKGNQRWTLFGASHDGPGRSFWHETEEALLATLLAWAGLIGDWRIFAAMSAVPSGLRGRRLGDTPIDRVRTLVTFEPFAYLPAAIRHAYVEGSLALVPSPASLVFFEHPRYRKLAHQLPRAMQIPLLQLFPRVERSCAIRIPQSGWLDESDPASVHVNGHRVVADFVRTHRWQRVARDADIHGEGKYTDKVSIALFSTEPIAVGLYDKPLARNCQIWNEHYKLVLDGWHADLEQLDRAARIVDAGGRFGYRMYYPPMRAGLRELFWHSPLIAASGRGRFRDGFHGYVSAELAGAAPLIMAPNLRARSPHVGAATLFERDPGRARHTTAHNVRKLLDTCERLGAPLAPSHARALVRVAREVKLEQWIDELPTHAADRAQGEELVAVLRACVSGAELAPSPPHVLAGLGTRSFEEQIWHSIAGLAHGDFKHKSNADGIAVNRGKHGGKAAKAAHIDVHNRRDLEALGDHLHARYREMIEATGMQGKAEVVDHVFAWETDFDFPWMEGWAKNQKAPAERNIVMMIPGKRRDQAVIMADHYDTAYMEDCYYEESGGDHLRAAAAGADDNHSATTALLLAAEHLLPLAEAGKLERDVWLVHLTGEEFPPDCLGARALCQALVERRLAFIAEDGTKRDVSHVDVVAAFVLDMIGHNADRDRDVFQIATGEGAGSAGLALRAHRANLAWNALVKAWNHAPERKGAGRAQRMPASARQPPPPFAHLALHGEVRVEWEPRSALYNTDGQIFSDIGIPVLLFMENYDISRKGYHDTHDTMENIDLDYCAALTAIAIETVADTACAEQV